MRDLITYIITLNRIIRERQGKDQLRKQFNCKVDETVILSINKIENFVLGKSSSIGAYTIIDISDFDSRHKTSKLIIGENSYVGELNNIRAAGGIIKIGDNCLISQNVNMICANHKITQGLLIKEQEWSTEKNFITIGNDVWIGCGAIILPGVTIGDGAVIAAGTLVNKDVKENSVVAGIPMRLIKMR